MATRAFTTDRSQTNMAYMQWSGLLNGDDGAPAVMNGMELVSWQVFGTVGAGGSAQVEASNEATPTTWGLIGAAATTAAMVFPADDIVARNIRPRVTAGDGTTSLTVIACFRRLL
ncbi:hypothetical protein [uncultured Sphingomonas sp.]|uniref:hypothetical protein n=1 Tax=uncultured Sphingomonas sp. TaxID=158754 RepID=UPI0035CBA9C2